MSENEVSEFVRTLLASGFDVRSVAHKPNFTLVICARQDEFGLLHSYLFAYAGNQVISSADHNALTKRSQITGAPLIVISDAESASKNHVALSRSQFFGKVGGAIASVLALEPDYGRQLVELGLNRLPRGLRGEPDDLFEAYVHSGLQFLLSGRVIRYGQERRFEPISDGIAAGRNIPLMLYDCKAADRRYEFSKTAIRQFADYVNDFHRRYEQYIGRLHIFVAISTEFQEIGTIKDRSDELYACCGIPLACLTAKSLADLVGLFSANVAFRTIVDWKKIFKSPLIEFARAKQELEARRRDRVTTGGA